MRLGDLRLLLQVLSELFFKNPEDTPGHDLQEPQHLRTAVKMGSAEPLPALKTSPKFVFFSDFDGTITEVDSNDHMTDTLGFGAALRKQGNQDVLLGRRPFRDSFKEMMESVKVPFDECVAFLLKRIQLSEGFREFYAWSRQENIPVVVLSGGMEPIIRALLENFLGKEEVKGLQIVSNSVDIREDGQWDIVFRDHRHGSPHPPLGIKEFRSCIDISQSVRTRQVDRDQEILHYHRKTGALLRRRWSIRSLSRQGDGSSLCQGWPR